jgi:glycosyltransferase involved in cell wall biosynthesis
MKVLLLGAFKSPEFMRRYGDPGDPGLGGSRKMTLLARSLVAGRHEVRVLSSKIGFRSQWAWQSIPPTVERFLEGEVGMHHASTFGLRPLGAAMMSFIMPLKILRTVRQWQPDAIFCYNADFPEAAGSVFSRKLFGVPYVLEVDDLPSIRRHALHPKAVLDSFGWSSVVRNARSLVLVNSQLLNHVTPRGRPCFLLPGIIENSLIRAADKRTPPFSGTGRSLLYAGGLSEGRGSDRLLAAIPNMPPGWRAVIAGSGPLAVSFQRLATEQPKRCEFLGLITPEALYHKLVEVDVVINTPEQLRDQAGVFPFKVFEYLACGAHIISTPLPKLAGFDLKWLERWSGVPEDLIELLESAPEDYGRFVLDRERTRDRVINQYSLTAVSRQLTGLLAATVGANR